MSFPDASPRPVDGSVCSVKYAPGERTSWLTTTRSAPLMMKVPRSVMIGRSPKNRGCSLISWVSLTSSLVVMNRGASYVVSLSRHSSGVYLGCRNSWLSKESSKRFWVKSSMGDTSSSSSRIPSAFSHSKASICIWTRWGTSRDCGTRA